MENHEIIKSIPIKAEFNIQLTLNDGSVLVGIGLTQNSAEIFKDMNIWDLKRTNTVDYMIDGNEIDLINLF